MVSQMRPKSGTTLTLSAEAWRKSVQDSWKESSTAGLLLRKDFLLFSIEVVLKIFSGQKKAMELMYES